MKKLNAHVKQKIKKEERDVENKEGIEKGKKDTGSEKRRMRKVHVSFHGIKRKIFLQAAVSNHKQFSS